MIEPKVIQVYRRIDEGEGVLKAIRDVLGLSQAELASRLGVTVTTVSRWETGRNSVTLTIPQVKALDELVDELGIRIKNLPDDFSNPKK